MADLTHFDASGRPRMVDVSQKETSRREAIARGRVRMAASTLALVRAGKAGKGDVLGVARLAGIMAAKRTADLIPLCHPLPISAVEVDLTIDDGGIDVEARVRTTATTGVEMEALTAVSVACLTVYDMCKAHEKGMTVEGIRLVYKSGGKGGTYEAPGEPFPAP